MNCGEAQNFDWSTSATGRWSRYGLVACVVATFTFLARHLQLDDGLIYDRYIDNAIHGLGLVYNAGEPVNALTSPLYDYLLLFVSWLLHGRVQMAAVVIFGVFFAGTCIVAETLFAYSGIVLSTIAYFYWLIGMETSVFLFFLMLSIALYVRGRAAFLPTILVLAALTRLEAGLLIVIAVWRLFRERRLPGLFSVVPGALLVISYLLINFRLYGHVVSDSSKAKFGQGMSGYWGAWPTAFLRIWHVWPYFAWTPYALLIIVVMGYKGVKVAKGSPWSSIVLPFSALLFLFYWLFNLPAYHWYYAPFLLVAIIYATVALTRRRMNAAVLVAVLVVQAATNGAWLVKSTSSKHEYARAGEWLAQSTQANARVAACEIGELGWVSHRYIIDILGLTTPKNAEYISRREPDRWLPEDKPDYIVVHRIPWVWEQVAVHSPDYEPTSFRSDTLVILRRHDVQ